MLSQEFRRKFLRFFEEAGHSRVPSSPVIPHDDPTLLFINAGMNQFKDVFLGKAKRDYTRATSSQKCIRVGGKHNDLDNVGHTSRHLTFFEMLGNFSFGDYFKREAIDFSWKVTTDIFQFDPNDLWVTVFENDDEAFELWQQHMPIERIVRMGEKDNLWAMGDTGPCGPCSELHFDKGPAYGDAPTLKDDASGDRYMEFWNLVFMEFNRDASGKMAPLPSQSIDTGAGLERIVSLKMGVDNVFHTDILRHLIGQTEKVCGVSYEGSDSERAAAFHVIADHIRSLSFAIADGVQPGNIERGYVLRKLLRRAIRYGRTRLGIEKPFLVDVFPALVETMGEDFPELASAKTRIEEILALEEEGFLRTLKRGGNILSTVVEKAVKSSRKEISGEDAFKLKDTYGFPLEEILLIAKDSGLQVNIDSYQLLEEKAKKLSRSSRSVASDQLESSQFEGVEPTNFVGYSEISCETEITAILSEGQFAQSLPQKGKASLVLKTTPFYAEKGGQVGDTGVISNGNMRFIVTSCHSPFPGVTLHEGYLELGTLKPKENVKAEINVERRNTVAAHHTATHLLHYALARVLGSHIRQAGSLVEADRLRFDFNHHKALTSEEIQEIEDIVNEKIRQDQTVTTYEIPFAEAQSKSEIKQFFGEKYDKLVRVVDIDYSKELCGGTHVPHVGMLGYFRITKEGSIASGVRRIEASCGAFAESFVREKEALLEEIAAQLKTTPQKVADRLEQLLQETSTLKKEVTSLKKGQLGALAADLATKVSDQNGNPLIAEQVEADINDLSELLMEKLKTGVVALATEKEGRAQLVVRVSPDLVKKGVKAGDLIKAAAPEIGGGGGGRPEMAQAGGKNPDGIEAALKSIRQSL